jgi:peptidylprolyl isomerase
MRNVEKIIVLLLLIAAVSIPACSQKEATTAPAEKAAESQAGPQGAVKTASGLSYTDLVKGNGAAPTSGKGVTVHYTGWLVNGTKFDSSVDRGQPFSFGLGAGQVIRGWDEGVAGMKIGGKRTLIIPPDLGYGARGAPGAIPPNATLMFDVELLGVQ